MKNNRFGKFLLSVMISGVFGVQAFAENVHFWDSLVDIGVSLREPSGESGYWYPYCTKFIINQKPILLQERGMMEEFISKNSLIAEKISTLIQTPSDKTLNPQKVPDAFKQLRRISNYYCDLMAWAIMNNDEKQAEKICIDSLKFINFAGANSSYLMLNERNGLLLDMWISLNYKLLLQKFSVSSAMLETIQQEAQKSIQILENGFLNSIQNEKNLLSADAMNSKEYEIVWWQRNPNDTKIYAANHGKLSPKDLVEIQSLYSDFATGFNYFYLYQGKISKLEYNKNHPIKVKFIENLQNTGKYDVAIFTKMKCMMIANELLLFIHKNEKNPQISTPLSLDTISNVLLIDPYNGKNLQMTETLTWPDLKLKIYSPDSGVAFEILTKIK